MSNLKDTEFEDLFRRASDKYPLRTNSADWDRMAAALEKDPPLPPGAADETDDRRKRRFLWLFLLLPLAGAGYYVWQGHGHGTSAMAGNNIVKTGGTAVGASQGAGSIPGAGAVPGAGSMSGGATVQGAEASRGAGVVPGTATSQGAGAIPGTGNYRESAGSV